MKIAVLFDGAGLARLGLEQAGHLCIGYEIDPKMHTLGSYVGRGFSHLLDVRSRTIDAWVAEDFDAYWMSPPCQAHSVAMSFMNTNDWDYQKHYKKSGGDLLEWSLELAWKAALVGKPSWVENVVNATSHLWGINYNAYQFAELQRRKRTIGGYHVVPPVSRPYKYDYPQIRNSVPPTCVATEYKNFDADTETLNSRYGFTSWYRKYEKRNPTIEDMAKAQGFEIPAAWLNGEAVSQIAFRYTLNMKKYISKAIGNGVPVYMAKAFGSMYD